MARSSSEAGHAGYIISSDTHPLYNEGLKPTPLRITLASLRKHVVTPNNDGHSSHNQNHQKNSSSSPASPRFDFFAHSWAPALEPAYRRELNFTDARFEDNRAYERALWVNGSGESRHVFNASSDWHQISYALSMSKAAEMVLAHEAVISEPDLERLFYSHAVAV